MNGFQLTVISAAVLGVALADCGKNSTQDTENAMANSVKEPNLSIHTWESDCQDNRFPSALLKASFSDLGTKMRRFYRFSGDGFRESVLFYSDKECEAPSAELQFEGKFDVRKEVTVGSANDVREVDLTYERVYAVALSDDASRAMRSHKFFGVSTWDKGTRIDLTDRTGEPASLLRAMPFTRHDVEEVNPDELRFGKTSHPLEAVAPKSNQRPAKLDDSDVYHHSRRSW